MILTELQAQGKGRTQLVFDDGTQFVLYDSELRGMGLKEHMLVDEALYRQLYYEILGKRVKRRAMHLLEKRDRTEMQLRDKLAEALYPEELIERAIDYVKAYHYIDDDRYARAYIRLNQERKSSRRMKVDLMVKGVDRDIIDRALEEENETPPSMLIKKLLEKRRYQPETATLQEKQKQYQYLLGKGFSGDEIWQVLS